MQDCIGFSYITSSPGYTDAPYCLPKSDIFPLLRPLSSITVGALYIRQTPNVGKFVE
jgi:hypothetical protein